MPTAHAPADFASAMQGRLDWTSDDLYAWAMQMAERCIDAQASLPDDVFHIEPVGENEASALARASDPKFWRRRGNTELKRAISHHAQHLKAVGGSSGPAYVSARNLAVHKDGVERAQVWARSHVILEQSARTESKVLADVMNTPEKAWAKTYTFIKGMQEVATKDNAFSWFMATVTLPGEYHANPSVGSNSWCGRSVKSGFDDLMEGINRMGARLAKENIRKIGIGSEEPQKDETPHLHEGIFFAGDDAYWRYLEEYARQFPGPLKVITGAKRKSVTVYATLADVVARHGVPGTARSPGRVTVTIGDAAAAAFASYMAKYISKNSGKGVAEDDGVHAGVTAVLAHRNAQSIRGWRFYGLPEGALSGWDELRRVVDKEGTTRHPVLANLIGLAKSGQAAEFIRVLGGLRVDAKPSEYIGLRLLTEARTNRYGEDARRTVGVRLVRFTRTKLREPSGKVGKRGKPLMRTRTETTKETLDSAITRLQRWDIVSAAEATGLHDFTADINRAVGVTHNYPRTPGAADPQRAAIHAPIGGSTVVTAAAGSGKTYTLVQRVKHLLAEGIKPKEVLVTTYTTKAATELKERMDAEGVVGVVVGTMHSISYGMLDGRVDDFDAMIAEAAKLGRKSFYLLLDEVQDLNPAQIAWAKAHAKALFVVGDPNQSIYGFRGAHPNGMLDLLHHVTGERGMTVDMFDHTPEVAMLENRRSTAEIVSLGNAISGSHAWSSRNGSPVRICNLATRERELERIASLAQDALVLVRTNVERLEVRAMLARAGVVPRDVMTIHAAKGMEAPRVVLSFGTRKDRTSNADEERRLAYVAVTRARDELVITSTGRMPEGMEALADELAVAF